MGQQRPQRVAQLLKEEISAIIQRELRDPRIGFVSVTEVSVTPDLRQAKVFVSIYGDEEGKRANIEALRSAAGRVRAILSRRLEMRYVPHIEFALDESLERGSRVFELLERVRREQPGEEQS
jgi:ribosome-binding factor A